jgi:Chalcone isomerase-like
MRKALFVTLAVLFLGAPASSAGAATLASVTLPDKVEANGQALVLNGLGLRKKFFVKVYVGALYLPAKEHDAARILAADAPRRMTMHFVYSVNAGQMCDAWAEGLADNTPNAAADVRQNFKSLCGWMEPIPDGHELVLTYLPAQGTVVEVNGKTKGLLPGKSTADAILATWLGPKPGPGDDFKQAVLGGK